MRIFTVQSHTIKKVESLCGQSCTYIMKAFVGSSGPPPANILEGSSFTLKGYKPAVKGNSPGTFSCKHQRKYRPKLCILAKQF
jgi:hypothetical protein